MSRWKRAFWSKKPEKPKNPELVAEKQLPCESLKASTPRETCAEGSVCTRVGTRAKADLAETKVESIWWDQEKSLGLHVEHQRMEDQSNTTNKLPVEVPHPQKPLQGWAVGGWQKSSDGGEVLMERSRSRAGDQMSNKLNLRSSQNTLL